MNQRREEQLLYSEQLRNRYKSAIAITIIENKIEFKLFDILVAPIILSMFFLKMLGKFNNSYKM